MKNLEQLTRMVDDAVRSLDIGGKPDALYAPIRYAMESGGKRVRPLLALASCNLAGGDPRQAVGAALAIELFHNFTLLHDDIMDKAALRRGRPTVHVKWNENTAILSGDAMFAYVYDIIARYDSPLLGKILRGANKIFMEVFEGQQYDMDFEKTEVVAIGQYLEMIRLKTSVLLGGAAALGAIAGGADDVFVDKMYDFGEKLGLAFQIQDDLLDTYGDEKTFGKTPGGDIASGKKTFLSVKALELSDNATGQRLQSLLADISMPKGEKFAAVCEIYGTTGVKRVARDFIDSCFREADSILDGIGVGQERKEPLRGIMRMLIKREK